MPITTGDAVVIEYTGRLDDGSVFDTSREPVAREAGLIEARADRAYDPLTVEIGSGQVIKGLEGALVGLETGDTPTVVVPPEKGYGERSEDHVREYDAKEFDQMVSGQTPEEGAYVETRDGPPAQVAHVDDRVVRVDFNHSLAGKTLEFDIEVLDVD
jgi:FKBP-type peptidyl-prolyl cis-trans isomerases 2